MGSERPKAASAIEIRHAQSESNSASLDLGAADIIAEQQSTKYKCDDCFDTGEIRRALTDKGSE